MDLDHLHALVTAARDEGDDGPAYDALVAYLDEQIETQLMLDVRAHVVAMPVGFHDGKLITCRSTTDADVIAWLAELRKLVR